MQAVMVVAIPVDFKGDMKRTLKQTSTRLGGCRMEVSVIRKCVRRGTKRASL